MKSARVRVLLIFFTAALLLSSCGGGTSNAPSGFSHRAFLTNSAFSSSGVIIGVVEIVDYTHDAVSGSVITVGSRPEFMVVSPDLTLTLVFDAADKTLVPITNSNETPGTFVVLPDLATSIVFAPNSQTAYIAVPNAVVGTNPAPATNGAVEIYSVASDVISGTLNIPRVSGLAMSHNGDTLLAFSNQCGAPSTAPACNQVTIVSTATNTTTTATNAAGTAPAAFDNPVAAFFSADDSEAYIVSCGAACGGSTASVTVLSIGTGAASPPVALTGATATAAFFDGTNLYLAGPSTSSGTVNLTNPGVLNILTVSNLTTLTQVKNNISIGTGSAQVMTLGSNNKLFIGATSCVNAPTGSTTTPGGCLSIYNTSTGTVVIDGPVKAGDAALGFVTGMTPVPKRSVVYVTEGGALLIYDTTTSAVFTGDFIDIVGVATDVVIVDPK